jgi:3-dehydroquinate synthase
MHESFDIASQSGTYPVEIGIGLSGQFSGEDDSSIFLVDTVLAGRFAALDARLIKIDATEANKSLDRVPAYIEALRNAGARRGTHIVAVGGGVIQDIATFAASIYMRGLPWTYLPTTVLGMVDSCIGGKSSINVLGYKNLAGNFYPPKRIVVDPDFVRSLNAEMITGGLLEAAKICYAYGIDKFETYLTQVPRQSNTPEAIQPIVSLALGTKKWFIETDEFDQNERLLLNFGHTFGHAAESATDFGISHGIAVGLGMLIACEFARRRQLLPAGGAKAVSMLEDHVRDMISALDSSSAFTKAPVPIRAALEKFEYDKKHRPDSFRVVVPCEDGALRLVPVPRTDGARADLASAYREILDAVGWPCI